MQSCSSPRGEDHVSSGHAAALTKFLNVQEVNQGCRCSLHSPVHLLLGPEDDRYMTTLQVYPYGHCPGRHTESTVQWRKSESFCCFTGNVVEEKSAYCFFPLFSHSLILCIGQNLKKYYAKCCSSHQRPSIGVNSRTCTWRKGSGMYVLAFLIAFVLN